MAILAYYDVMLREPRLLVPGTQPIGLVIPNNAHPLSKGLIDWSLQLKRKNPGTITEVATTRIANAQGRYIELASGGTTGIRWDNAQPAGLGQLTLTFVARFLAQNGDMLVESSPIDTSNTGCFYLYGLSATSLRLRTKGATDGSYQTDVTYTIPTTQSIYTIAFDMGQSPHYHRLFVNGQSIVDAPATTTVSAQTVPGVTNTHSIWFGSRNINTLFGHSAYFGDVLIHDRMLSAGEIRSLQSDFYQAFVPA